MPDRFVSRELAASGLTVTEYLHDSILRRGEPGRYNSAPAIFYAGQAAFALNPAVLTDWKIIVAIPVIDECDADRDNLACVVEGVIPGVVRAVSSYLTFSCVAAK